MRKVIVVLMVMMMTLFSLPLTANAANNVVEVTSGVGGVRTFSWTGYATIPRLCRYSQGLIFPSDVLIRFVLYHSRYLLRISMNSDILTPVQS